MAQCTTPYHHKDRGSFPCGKCYDCKMNRVSGWAFRLEKEAERSSSAFFITLTYDNDHIPVTQNKFMTVQKEDIQKFFKRLRKQHDKTDRPAIKYYAAAEYGGETDRPHYHIILFNATEEHIQKAWQLGQIHYGTLTGASIQYTLKYICKNATIPRHNRDDRQREFSLMSKKLGDNYLTPQMIDWHKKDILNRMYVPTLDDHKITMPRYYKEKIYTHYQRMRISENIKNQKVIEFQQKNLSTIEKEELKQYYVRTRKSQINSKKEQRNNTKL